MKASGYTGRFAPSPSGPLHFGSLVTALGSYIDARHHGGRWLLRIEDIDTARCVPGAADAILRTLEGFALYWDETPVFQTRRQSAYEAALAQLRAQGAVYPCACSRQDIRRLGLPGLEGPRYPGTCREGMPAGTTMRSLRLDTRGARIAFADRRLGRCVQDVEAAIGDFVVRRADGPVAYHLAVVVDDAWQGVSDVVRGADLLDSTARQIHLQTLLGLPTPRYLHLPLALGPDGRKLSKQNHAPGLDPEKDRAALPAALSFLGFDLPPALQGAPATELLSWAALQGLPSLSACS
ncbi:MAG: tRNA glutamyl-Q(34) synthetase GluQRS [Halothiobacillaceae bacterium]|nr:tRNA glutamyl-Q(34) synthetase GluQRS [Halothiobacillaceae bacterium]